MRSRVESRNAPKPSALYPSLRASAPSSASSGAISMIAMPAPCICPLLISQATIRWPSVPKTVSKLGETGSRARWVTIGSMMNRNLSRNISVSVFFSEDDGPLEGERFMSPQQHLQSTTKVKLPQGMLANAPECVKHQAGGQTRAPSFPRLSGRHDAHSFL